MKPLRDLLLRDDLGTFRETVESAVSRVASLHSEQTIEMKCDWRVAIENALEAAHVDHIHPTTLARVGLKEMNFIRSGKNSMAEYEITDERTRKGLMRILPHVIGVRQWKTYFHLFIYPHTCLSSVGGFTYSLQNYFPTETGTVLLTRLYIPHVRGDSARLGFFFDAAAAFNKQVFEEDAALCSKIHLRCIGQQMKPALQRLRWFAEARNDINKDFLNDRLP